MIAFLALLCYTMFMGESGEVGRDAIEVYMDGAREALESAQYNLDGGFYGVAVNRAYYAYFYAAIALLLTLNMTRSKHAGVLAAFREHFVRPGSFPIEDSRAYGEAFELRNVTDYEMLGRADEAQARIAVESASRFVSRCAVHLAEQGYR
jgi:uncharacterized protein (UPF0332 family)